MSQSGSIAASLPYLRRFARALTGSQASGDAYAIATLEAIAEDAGAMDTRSGASAGSLSRSSLKIWGSGAGQSARRHRFRESRLSCGPLDRTLEALTPLPRVVFLLRSLEGFTTTEIAVIMERPQSEILELLDVAGREIMRLSCAPMCWIIEDEPIIAMDLGGDGQRPLAR